jgi:hypothetical protein
MMKRMVGEVEEEEKHVKGCETHLLGGLESVMKIVVVVFVVVVAVAGAKMTCTVSSNYLRNCD